MNKEIANTYVRILNNPNPRVYDVMVTIVYMDYAAFRLYSYYAALDLGQSRVRQCRVLEYSK